MNGLFRVLLAVICLAPAAFAQPAADALFERSRAAHEQGRIEEAEIGYRRYLTRYGPKPEVLGNLGVILAKKESYPEAVRLYQQALKIDPSLFLLRLNLGLALFKQGRH